MQLAGSQQTGCKHFVHSLLRRYIKDGACSGSLSGVMPSWHQSLQISHREMAEKCRLHSQRWTFHRPLTGSVGFWYIMSLCLTTVFWPFSLHCWPIKGIQIYLSVSVPIMQYIDEWSFIYKTSGKSSLFVKQPDTKQSSRKLEGRIGMRTYIPKIRGNNLTLS